MGLLAPFGAFVTSVGAGTWIQLLLTIGVVALTYAAMSRIITQAGYSSLWILLPLAPLVLTIACFVILWHDLNGIVFGGPVGFYGIEVVGLFWHLDEIALLLNWIFFIVFAFSRWPGATTRHAPESEASRAIQAVRPGPRSPASVPLAPSDRVTASRGAPTSGAGPGAAPAAVTSTPAAKRPGAKFCAWCGESLPGNRALFHDCGPKDRPETHCKNCGTVFDAGSSECRTCGAA
jgi:hypothetical protein